MSEVEILSRDAATTASVGRALAPLLKGGDLIFLSGELGAGKTTFVRALAEALGVAGPVTSPTFTVAQRYVGRVPLAHMDAYRLSGDADDEEAELLVDALGGGAIACVEWPEAIAALLPEPTVALHLEHAGGDRRLLRLSTHDSALRAALEGIRDHLSSGHRDR